MNKKLVPIGNGWSVYMPVHIIKLLEVKPEKDSVSIKMSKQTLIITKANN